MARPTTLPGRWLDLANAVGGISKLHGEIGLSKMGLWRMAHGLTNPRTPVRKIVAQIAALYRLPDPLAPGEEKAPDLRVLKLMGEGLRKGVTPPEVTVFHVHSIWPMDTLINIAESETDEEVLLAVTYLLEAECPSL